ncbi:MAG: hypothetical protein ACJ8E3_06990 [Sphingomicrobium sp.]
MSALRLLNPQGIAGLAGALCLGLLLLVQSTQTRHWKKASARFEQLYRAEQTASAQTVANYRAAADAARAADRAASDRARAEQNAISERTMHDYETRLADARDRARRLQPATAAAAADPCRGGAAPMSRLSPAPCGADQAAGQGRLPDADALIATEQAIQLDELIRWVRRQAEVDPNATAPAHR